MERILLSWSSGKDSTWALHVLRRQGLRVAALVTTVNEAASRVAMHAVRLELLQAQAEAAGLPLWQVPIPHPCANAVYEERFAAALARARAEGFTHVAFGDLFLEDIRRYREQQLAGTRLAPLFPVWGLDTRALAREMLGGGLKARVTCVDTRVLPETLAGREFDASFLDELPSTIDPCGERGEFHTFAYASPEFVKPIEVTPGKVVVRDGFAFADLAYRCGARL